MPKRLQYIISLIIKRFKKSGNSLPAPLILRGESGVGKSWVLSQLSEQVLDISNEISIVPIVVKYHLTAKNIVTQLKIQIEKQEKKYYFKNEIEGTSKKQLKFVLIWDGLDKIYNIFSHDRSSKSPKRSFGAGSPITQKILYASELRSFLIENVGKVTLVGTSTYIDFMTDEDLPFFNFFNIINIEALSHDESIDYVQNKIRRNERANKLFEFITSLESSAGIDICDGKISYLNIFSGSILEAVETEISKFKDLIKYFYALFFSKLNPFIDIEIKNLSEGEKILLSEIMDLPNNFHLKDVIDHGLNKTKLMRNLVNKEILSEEGRGKTRIFSIKSEALKKWIRYHRDPNSILHGI